MALASSLSLLAERLGLDPIAAVALPATIGNAAAKCGMSDAEMIRNCWDIPELGEYIATICNYPETREVAEQILTEKEAAQ